MSRTKLKLFLTVLAVATAGSFMFAKPASALNPNDIPGGMRGDISNYDSGCPGVPEKYALYTWISPSGQPTQTSLTVPYGTQDVNLDLNQLVFVCRQYVSTNGASYPGLPQDGTVSPTAYNGSISKATSGFSATNGSLQNIGGLLGQSTIYRNNGTRYWFSNPVQFTYHANSPMTSSQVVIVSFNQKFANIFGGSIACAVPPGPGGYVGSLDNCNEGAVAFAITINVNAPQWSLSSNTTANKASMFPGDTVTFNYRLHNNGPDAANFQYVTRVQEYINGVAQPINPVSRPNGDGSWPVPNAVEASLPAGANEPSYSVRGYTALYNPNLTRVCSWIEYAGQASWNGSPGASNHYCVNITQPVPTCVPLTINPLAIEPGTPFTAYASVTYQSQPAAYWTYQSGGRSFIKITGPGGYNQDLTFNGPSPTAANISNTFSLPAPTATGIYSVTYGVRNGTIGQITCPGATPQTFKVAYSPYLRAQGGNVLAGVGFGTACTTTPGKITSWNKYTGSTTPYYGAGTDLAAIALGQITGFVSGNNQDGTMATNGTQAPGSLTFANTTANVAAGIYGGGYGVTNWCMPDYAGDAATAPGVAAGTTVAAAIAGANGTYTLTGNQTLAATSLSGGKRITIVITGGDLTITGDVTYSYGSLVDIPRLQIFVKGGNINIAPGVHNLSGVYGAQKSTAGVGGQINTCTGAFTYANCNSTLTFYGVVYADQILLRRMSGTASSPTTAAEQFVYGPETWLGRNFAVPDTAWESATSLSPIL